MNSKPWAFETGLGAAIDQAVPLVGIVSFDVVLTTVKGDVVLVEGAETYIEALSFVVEHARREMSKKRRRNNRATDMTERQNGWNLHYPNRVDLIDIVEMVSTGN